MFLYLAFEFRAGVEESERVVVGFAEKFDATRRGERLQALDDFGRVPEQLFKRDARDGKAHAELRMPGKERK